MTRIFPARVTDLVLTFALIIPTAQLGTSSQGATTRQSAPQDLNQKLRQKAALQLKAEAPLDQLIEIAKRFQVPMGIEWSDSTECLISPAIPPTDITVRKLLMTIVSRCPAQTLSVDRGVVHVRSRFARHPQNILNLRLCRFDLKKGNVFDAEHELRLDIDMHLHPEKYTGGTNGGYGFPPDHVFAIDNVSFSAKNVRVRSVLDGIIRSNGNALWLVRLNAASLNRRIRFSRVYKDREAIVRIFEFIPLKDTPEK